MPGRFTAQQPTIRFHLCLDVTIAHLGADKLQSSLLQG